MCQFDKNCKGPYIRQISFSERRNGGGSGGGSNSCEAHLLQLVEHYKKFNERVDILCFNCDGEGCLKCKDGVESKCWWVNELIRLPEYLREEIIKEVKDGQ